MDTKSIKELGFPEYWNTRYETASECEGATHEWFRSFEKLRPFLEKELPDPSSKPRMLHLGCGDSTLPADLFNLHYANQLSVDFSGIVIKQMQSRYPHIEWRIDDGTLDAMLYGSQWDPPEEVRDNVRQYVNEVFRILKPEGRWFYITFRQPHFVKPQLMREGTWDFVVERLEDGPGTFEYFAYVMTKHSLSYEGETEDERTLYANHGQE